MAQKSIAQAENFPFCTIEPNRVPIAMPDKYLQSLGKLAKSLKTIPAYIELVDVAGLVSGASRGEGLGNQFLATVRECDAVCHVIRYFDDANIIHVSGRVSPAEDAEVVNLELVFADIAHIERRLEKITCQNEERIALETLLPELRKGIPARTVMGGLPSAAAAQEFSNSIKSMGLLTLKPIIYVFNVDEVDFLFDKDKITMGAKCIFDSIQYCDASRDLFTIVSAKLQASMLTTNNVGGGDDATREYLKSVGFDIIGQDDDDQKLDNVMGYNVLPNMIRQVLDLFVVYVGPGVAPERSRTTRAFLIGRSSKSKLSSSSSSSLHTTAIGLAGRLHGDIEKGFIRAEVTPACKLLEFASYTAAKDAGVVRTEGKDYVLQEDDVVLIKWK